MHKKIFFKVIIIFLIMATALAMTIGFSYVAIDTQKQHIAITEVVGAERVNMEKFSQLNVNIAEKKLNNSEVEISEVSLNDMKASIEALEHIFEELDNRQYTLIDGSVTQLNLSGDFEKLLFDKLDEIKLSFNKGKILSSELLNKNANDLDYKDKLVEFEALNPRLLTLSDELVRLCLEEANVRSNFSFIMQSISLLLAFLALGLLIYYLIKDFYKPIMKMKKMFKDLSQGSLSKRLVRDTPDEFASLFDDLNFFLNHLDDLMTFENKILEESSINKLLYFVEDQFTKFIPFDVFGIIYKKDGMIQEIRVCDTLITENVFETDDLDKIRDQIVNNNENKKVLISAIEMNGLIIGWSYFGMKLEDFEPHHIDFVQLLEKKLSMAFYKSLLFNDLLGMVTNSLAKMAEKKDPETGNHLKRMAMYTRIMAKGLSELELYKDVIDASYIRNIYLTAPMHDIGKVAIRDDILLKPGKLTFDEFEIMKTHVTSGSDILNDVNNQFSSYNITYFQMAQDIACYHHEKFDGSGYPSQIVGKDIPLSARICAIADVFDALGSKRPYKEAFSLEKCYAILEEGRGQHFDPEILDIFFEKKTEIEEVYHEYKEI